MAVSSVNTGCVSAMYFNRPILSSAGDVYVFGRPSSTDTTGKVSAFKSSDPFGTGFSLVTTSNAPPSWVAGNVQGQVAAARNGDTVHLFWMRNGSAGMCYAIYSMATDTFTQQPTVPFTTNCTATAWNDITVQTLSQVQAFVRSDGSIVLGRFGQHNGNTHLYVDRLVSGTWTAGTQVDISNKATVSATIHWGYAVLGASDRVHFVWVDSTVSAGSPNITTITFSSANALDAASVVLYTTSASGDFFVPPLAYTQSGTTYIQLQFPDSAFGNDYHWRRQASAAAASGQFASDQSGSPTTDSSFGLINWPDGWSTGVDKPIAVGGTSSTSFNDHTISSAGAVSSLDTTTLGTSTQAIAGNFINGTVYTRGGATVLAWTDNARTENASQTVKYFEFVLVAAPAKVVPATIEYVPAVMRAANW